MNFDYIYSMPPIDFWEGAGVVTGPIADAVLEQMPEEPRTRIVYGLLIPIPGSCELEPVYLCKADNNGTTYVFSKYEIKQRIAKDLRIISSSTYPYSI